MHSDGSSRDFYHRFYSNCEFFHFFLTVLSVRLRDSDLFESTAFSKRFFGGAGEKILKNVKWAQFEAVLPSCGEHCP